MAVWSLAFGFRKVGSSSSIWLPALVSLGAGVLLAFAIRVNATLGAYVGPLGSTFVVHLVGTVFALALLVRRLDRTFRQVLRHRPRYELTGGLFGVVMVLVANLVVPHLGMALSVGIFVASDLLCSTLSDHAGWFGFRRIPLSRRRVLGLVLAVAGVLLVRWG
ncbi:hypothetical protein AWN76_006410 [Rhodothermaceae bacterium RA]|nr:hypothetical protein AWN76_006410 [Rhodothermaceae bacterium RA]